MESEEARSLTESLFHVAGPDTAKLRRPMVFLVPGTTSVPLFADRSCHLPTTDEAGVCQVGRCQTMQALVKHHSQLETDTLPDWKPVKITQNWNDVVGLPGSSSDARCCVVNSLQLCQQTITDSIQQAVAVIKSAADECMHQCFCCFQDQWWTWKQQKSFVTVLCYVSQYFCCM